ncbi:hypothetical protein [Paenibacillus sp. GCM10012306]|uniref:hypothetical protein n=1 Tax=Paenibacillus sp. GCM10012306 TaxID=3317342 RepID=UPI0036239554
MIHIVDEKNGKEIDSISTDAPISSLNVAGDQLYIVDLSGHVTAIEFKTKMQEWQYGNDVFEVPKPLC